MRRWFRLALLLGSSLTFPPPYFHKDDPRAGVTELWRESVTLMSSCREHHVDPGPGKEEAWGSLLPSLRGTRRPNCLSVSSQLLDIEDTNQGLPCPHTPKDEAKPTRRAHHSGGLGSPPLASHGGSPASGFMGEAGGCWQSSLPLAENG